MKSLFSTLVPAISSYFKITDSAHRFFSAIDFLLLKKQLHCGNSYERHFSLHYVSYILQRIVAFNCDLLHVVNQQWFSLIYVKIIYPFINGILSTKNIETLTQFSAAKIIFLTDPEAHLDKQLRDHSFSKFAKFSEKLIFLKSLLKRNTKTNEDKIKAVPNWDLKI